MLPDFVFVGTMKGGTTALARGMSMHPAVYIAPNKEVHFFDQHFDEGLDWYAEQFAEATEGQVTGDASPGYMYDPVVADRMMDALPEARFLAIVRNPVDRAYSHYWHNRRRRREMRTFEDVIEDEHPAEPIFDYLGLGHYADRLRTIEERVGQDRLLVFLNEDLRNDRGPTLRRGWEFVGVAPELGSLELPRRPKTLVAWIRGRRRAAKAEYPPMDRSMRRRLTDLYADEVNAFEEYLGRDLSHWRA